MSIANTDPLAAAQLSERESRTVARFASRLQSTLKSDLRALWLYGSRARRTAHPESDVDLLVIAEGGRQWYGRVVDEFSEDAAIAEGESPFTYSIHIHDFEWLRGRRAIDSFFIQEVDREKVVLAGSELDWAPAPSYGMLYAARAALSERGEFAKTHSGTWTLFSQVFVAPGEFEQRLSALARRTKDAREEGDYEASPPSAEEAKELVIGAAEFIAEIERILAAA